MNGKIDMLAATLERTSVASTPRVSYASANPLVRPQDLSLTSSVQLPGYEGKGLAGNSLQYYTRTTFQSMDKLFGLLRISSVSRQYISIGSFNEETENNESGKILTFNVFLRFGSCRKGFKLRINDTFDNWCLN